MMDDANFSISHKIFKEIVAESLAALKEAVTDLQAVRQKFVVPTDADAVNDEYRMRIPTYFLGLIEQEGDSIWLQRVLTISRRSGGRRRDHLRRRPAHEFHVGGRLNACVSNKGVRRCSKKNLFIAVSLMLSLISGFSIPASAQEELPIYLQDRGEGIATSMFGIYLRKGEVIFYPFYEYYRDKDAEYKPAELGFLVDADFRGKFRAHEGLIFFGYGISDRLALEVEAAVIDATQYKAGNDPSKMPAKISESGLGDVESQLRWRWSKENSSRPEWFSYFETVFPLQKNRVLIGTQNWEFKLGTGIIKGFGWGTVTARVAVDYTQEENKAELGEYAVEYLKRTSNRLRLYAGVEGTQDEVELITEAQVFLAPQIILKLNSALGVTSKATGFAPEVGIMFFFR